MRDLIQTARTSRGQYGSDRSDGATIVYPAGMADPSSATRAARVWPRALHPFRSPCRIDAGKGFAQHRCSTAHAAMVESYRAWRDGEYATAEAHDAGTAHSPRHGAEEDGSYWSEHARPTFGDFLRKTSEAAREEARAARVRASFDRAYAARRAEEAARADGLRRAARVRTGPPCVIDDGPADLCEPAGNLADGCGQCAECTPCACPTCTAEAPRTRPEDWI